MGHGIGIGDTFCFHTFTFAQFAAAMSEDTMLDGFDFIWRIVQFAQYVFSLPSPMNVMLGGLIDVLDSSIIV